MKAFPRVLSASFHAGLTFNQLHEETDKVLELCWKHYGLLTLHTSPVGVDAFPKTNAHLYQSRRTGA